MAITSDPRRGGKNTRQQRRRGVASRSGALHTDVMRAPATIHAIDMDPNVQITQDTHIACLSVSCYLNRDDEKPTLLQMLLTPIQLARLQNQIAGAMLTQVHTGASILTTMAKKTDAHELQKGTKVTKE